MSPDAMHFTDYQTAFAARLRDPKGAPHPPGAPRRRMRVYEELLFNNLEGFLLACYPVTRKILGARAWKRTARRFFSEHSCHSPLFRDIPKAFLDWMEKRGASLFPAMPFISEFMHYEWLELAVSIAPGQPDLTLIDPDGDLLRGRPVLNSSARLACYRYPVHRIGPRFKPTHPGPIEHCYLLFRDERETDFDHVRFIQLNPLAVRLLSMLRDHQPSGREALAILAAQTQPEQYETLLGAGHALLESLRVQGAVLGTWRLP